MRSPRQSRLLWLALCAGVGPLSPQARAIVTFGGTGNNYGEAPGNVGIYEGMFDTGFTATPITGNMILTASHLFPATTTTFVYNNGTATATTYTVQVAATLDDLAAWEIAPNQTGAFSLTAPIYTGDSEVGSTIVDVGRGYQRGVAITGGWDWAGEQGPFSWGTNTVSAVVSDTQLGTSGALGGDFLEDDFNDENPSSPGYNANECMVTPYDSGGGVFIDVGGQYQLAGVNSVYDGVYDSSGNSVGATLYDVYGYYYLNSQNAPVQITTHGPESSFATRISSRQNFVELVDGAIPASQAAMYPINDDGLLTLYSNLTTGAITGGAQVLLGPDETVKMTMANNSGDSAISSLTIDNGSTLDITNNAITIDYGDGTDPIASIAALITSGYAHGTWTGTGITSSSAQGNSGSYGIGYADSADPGNPAGLASDSIEIMYTLLGDANLDGKVNGIDFDLMAMHFNQAVTDGWDEGDFNYDGKVNGSDFLVLAENFDQAANQSASAATDLAALEAFATANGIEINLPEPASAGVMVVVGLAVLRRRRSRPQR